MFVLLFVGKNKSHFLQTQLARVEFLKFFSSGRYPMPNSFFKFNKI